MADYTTTLVDEAEDSVIETQPTPKRWRWLALAMTVAGVLAVASIGWPRKKLTTRQRVKKVARSMISAYQRKLQDDPDYAFHDQTTAVVKPVGANDPSAMKIEIRLKTHDEELKHDEVRIHFAAKEGKQDDLHQAWQHLATALDNEEYQGVGAGMGSALAIGTHEPNDVAIKLVIPEPDGEDMSDEMNEEQEIEQDLSKLAELDPFPMLKVELSTGRDLDAMLENLHDPEMLMPGGFSISGSFGLTQELIQSIRQMEEEQDHQDVAGKLRMGEELESLVSTSRITIQYDEEKIRIAEEAKPNQPSGEERLAQMKQAAQGAFHHADVQDQIRKLAENSDGLSTIRFVTKAKYELALTFTNFKVSAALAKLMEPDDGGHTDGGDSDGGDSDGGDSD